VLEIEGLMPSAAVRKPSTPLRFLFVKSHLAYPRSSGHDIRAFHMMRALAELGHPVGLVTAVRPIDEAVRGSGLEFQTTLAERSTTDERRPSLTWAQRRYASYFGVSDRDRALVADAANAFRADVVVGMGADVLPYLAGSRPRKVWYAGDEWVTHYRSLVKLSRPATWRNLRTATIWGVYQRSFVPLLERIWVVAPAEARAMRRWAGAAHVDVLSNGVDADYFAPQAVPEQERAAVFWGRLDFTPNIQALAWFCKAVWPLVRARFADATFRIIGFHPGADAQALAALPGVSLIPDLADLRSAVCGHGVVAMPFQSGGGIKNKMLEAASMARPIVCTPLACQGLRTDPPVIVAERPQDWVDAFARLWTDAAATTRLRQEVRAWAIREHSWRRTAADAVESLQPVGAES
jgi:glycosyltransferase involved in cell wall biosynthesis